MESSSTKIDQVLETLSKGICQYHPEEKLNAFCSNEGQIMCLKCTLEHGGHRLHLFESLDEGEAIVREVLSAVYCTKHDSNLATVFCLTEKRVACQVCCMITCKTHQVQEFDAVYEEAKHHFEEVAEKISESLSNARDKTWTGFEEKLTAQKLAHEQEINSKYDDLLAQVEAERKSKLNDLDKAYESIKEQLQDCSQTLTTIKDIDHFRTTLLTGPKLDLISLVHSPKMKQLQQLDSITLQNSIELLQGQHLNRLITIKTPTTTTDKDILSLSIRQHPLHSNDDSVCLFQVCNSYTGMMARHYFDGRKEDKLVKLSENEFYGCNGDLNCITSEGQFVNCVTGQKGDQVVRLMKFCTDKDGFEEVGVFAGEAGTQTIAMVEFDQDVFLLSGGYVRDGDLWMNSTVLFDVANQEKSTLGDLPVKGMHAFAFEMIGQGRLIYCVSSSSTNSETMSPGIQVYNRGVMNSEFEQETWVELEIEGLHSLLGESFKITSLGHGKIIIANIYPQIAIIDINEKSCRLLSLDPSYYLTGSFVWAKHEEEIYLTCGDGPKAFIYSPKTDQVTQKEVFSPCCIETWAGRGKVARTAAKKTMAKPAMKTMMAPTKLARKSCF